MLSQKLYEYTTDTLSSDAEMIFYNGVPDFMIRKLIESKTIREILLPYITKGKWFDAVDLISQQIRQDLNPDLFLGLGCVKDLSPFFLRKRVAL